MIYCINHSACGSEKTLYSPFSYDDPNLPPSPPVPADSNRGPKRKPCFQVFISSISTILYSEGEAGGFCLRLPLPSWCSIQRSRFGSTTVSTLVHGCEETTCYLLFADRYTERWGERRGNVCRPIYSGQLSSRSILLDYKKCTASFPLPRLYSFNGSHSSCTDSNEGSRFEEFNSLVEPLGKYSAFLDSLGTQRTLPNKSALTHSHALYTVVLLSALKEG